MAIFLIPTNSDLGVYTQRVTLDGVGYFFQFVINSRDGAWYMDVSDNNGVAIINGRRVTSNNDMLAVIQDIRRPPGILFAGNASQSPQEPNETTFGSDIPLAYIEAA